MRLHDDLVASMPEGARHDSDICPFCVDKATQTATTTSRIPPASSGGPDVSETDQSQTNTEGGTPQPMDTISKETHDALLQKAVADATSVTEKALETANENNKELTAKLEKLESDNASLKADNDRINGELDKAQVSLKTAQDEVASLKQDIAAKEEQAAKAELASKRGEQVKNLGLFDEKVISERASAWADLAEDDWAARVEEWQHLKPASTTTTSTKTDTASAMSGTSEELTKEPATETASESKPPARRAALGLI